MCTPLVEDLPDEAKLFRGVDDRLELDVLQLLAACTRVQHTLHMRLDHLQLALHLFLLDLDVLRLGRLGDRLQARLKLVALVLELMLHVLDAFAKLGTVVRGHRIDARIVGERFRPPRLAPDVIRLAEAALRSLGVMVTHGLNLRDTLEQLVEVLIRQVVQRGIQSETSKGCFSLSERPVDVV